MKLWQKNFSAIGKEIDIQAQEVFRNLHMDMTREEPDLLCQDVKKGKQVEKCLSWRKKTCDK